MHVDVASDVTAARQIASVMSAGRFKLFTDGGHVVELHDLSFGANRNATRLRMCSHAHRTGEVPEVRIQLLAALGMALLYTRDSRLSTEQAWQDTIEIAEDLQDIEYQLRGLRGLWSATYNAGDIETAISYSNRFSKVTAQSARADDVPTEWSAKSDFSGPTKPAAKPALTAWERYAQVLLLANELVFVD